MSTKTKGDIVKKNELSRQRNPYEAVRNAVRLVTAANQAAMRNRNRISRYSDEVNARDDITGRDVYGTYEV